MSTFHSDQSVYTAGSRIAYCADLAAQARWENEGGATLPPVAMPFFFSQMFNWFRPPNRQISANAASSSLPARH